jgi:hypothetical protein
MKTQIINYCSTKGLISIANFTLELLSREDWSDDSFLTRIIEKLEQENQLLTQIFNDGQRVDYPLLLAEKEAVVERDLIGLKYLINQHSKEKNTDIASNANYLRKIVDAHTNKLPQQDLRKRISTVDALLRNIDRVQMRERTDSLKGIPGCIHLLKTSAAELEVQYRESLEAKEWGMTHLSPIEQKKMVRHLFNKVLLPYLEMKARIEPDVYHPLQRAIQERIKTLNTITRSNRKKKAKDRQLTLRQQENLSIQESIPELEAWTETIL